MRTLLILSVLLAAGCKQVPMLPYIGPHKIDVQQGNYISQEMVSKLKPGMTRSQVRFLLGTPLIVDPFHSDRWDYVYTFAKRGELTEQRRIVVVFDNDKLARVEGDVVPAAPGSETANASPQATPAKPAPSASGEKKAEPPAEEKGFLGRMRERLGF
jgi:outer membrane protein assembly factor BamE